MHKAIRSIPFTPVSPVWMKAAVAGSVWASLEIIIGSFLHNLRVPFSGTMLAVMSVYLLVAFVQIWNDRGLVWRAGLICALMKSVSPSAVILGPMTGIMLEALLISLFLGIFGRNLIGYLIGGAAAVLSSLIHKVVTLLILYGFDLVRIFSELYDYSVRQINIESASPVVVVVIIASVYSIAGMIGAAGGRAAGLGYLRRKAVQAETGNIKLNNAGNLFSQTTAGKYSILFLVLNIILVVSSLALLNTAPLYVALPFGSVYVAFIFNFYRNSLKRLRKPGVWIQFALITLISAFLWNSVSDNGFFGLTGLMAGFKMIWRAIIIIAGFAAISVELKNPLIKSVLYKRGFANLYQSLTLAFSALPSVIAGLPKPSELLGRHRSSIGHLLRTAEELLPVLEEEHAARPDIFIITGERQQGKTMFLKEMVSILTAHGISVSGFVSEGIHTDTGREGFMLRDIQGTRSAELCRTDDRFNGIKQGRYYFNPDAIKLGSDILGSTINSETRMVVIDEVGPLEISGGGWYAAIGNLTSASTAVQVWSVRKSLAEKAARRWNVGNVIIFDISLITPDEAAGHILVRMKESKVIN
ncbi:MAG: DUF2478 domain-containing protein [Bacteroidales bacterium]|nr:DUF2478 domain-containing protein [Bacteroidales bacterium]